MVDEVKLGPVPNALGSPTPRFTYRIKNFGKTPGIMVACKAELTVGSDFNLPPNLDFLELQDAEVDKSVIPQGESVPKNSKSWQSYLLPNEERAKVIEGESILWACGCIHYVDVFGRPHRTPFCYTYTVSFDQFYPNGLPEYNQPT